MIIRQMLLFQRLIVLISISRHVFFEIEKFIGIMPDVALWRGGQAHKKRIEVFKNGSIFFKNTPVCLVNDDQIEMAWRKQLQTVLRLLLIDGIHNRRIC